MTNRALGTRAAAALAILREGGHFSYGLETNGYTRREQFQWRLKTKGGGIAKGFGSKTYHELVAAGIDFAARPQGFTGIATHYHLREESKGSAGDAQPVAEAA